MLNLKDIRNIYFLGVGGIGMSALARYFVVQGYRVFGYDRNRSSLCRSLERIGVEMSYDSNLETLSILKKEDSLVVYTPAIPKDNPIYKSSLDQGYHICKRAVVLGLITASQNCLAIAGTHGKTTISSMLTHILSENGVDCSAFLGGIATGLDSNLRIGQEDTVVVEADEFDRSFLHLSPTWALISSMDPDHLDIYGSAAGLNKSFQDFARLVEDDGLICKEGLAIDAKYTYGLNSETADFSAYNIEVVEGVYVFDLRHPKGICKRLKSGLPGIHNVENSVAAFAMAFHQNVAIEGIVDAIASFKGVKRRFEYHLKQKGLVYIDDYAHHPSEIAVAIRSARDLYPKEKLTVIFQPHLFSRTQDFMDDFAEVLSRADRLILLDIYPARELPIEGVNSEALLAKVNSDDKCLLSKNKLVENLCEQGVIMTLGAGDIDQLIKPIKKKLSL